MSGFDLNASAGQTNPIKFKANPRTGRDKDEIALTLGIELEFMLAVPTEPGKQR